MVFKDLESGSTAHWYKAQGNISAQTISVKERKHIYNL